MLTIGLTGGIGSGKSTVAKLFITRGIKVIDTDEIARTVTRPDHPALAQIVEYFGPEVILKDGTLNRAMVKKIIFEQPEKRLWLENLLHPLIREETAKQIATATSPYCIVLIPLLFETEPNPLVNRFLVIDATEEQQIARVQARDNLTKDEVLAIIQTQVSRDQRLRQAHDIIENRNSQADLRLQVEKLHQYYLSLSMAEASKK